MSTVAALAWMLLGAWLVLNAGVLAWSHRTLRLIWREPVLWPPALVIESDDWGAGPLAQAAALDDVARVLQRHRDAQGRQPVFSLALVLAVPDGPAIAARGGYHRSELDAPRFLPLLQALRRGEAQGVFAFQLHGLEHYWPAALRDHADPAIQRWLRQPEPAVTEALPPPLQSRWVDACVLPSTPHAIEDIEAAVADEVQVYERIFGQPPRVVVPPTFVWTRHVEAAWARRGVQFVVTPGWRYVARGADALPGGDEGPFVNGDRAGGIVYLVRTDYFEPLRGRGAAHAVRAICRAAQEGRPCVLENHRDNFLDAAERDRSLAELDTLLTQALAAQPALRFLSTAELGRIIREGDPHRLVIRQRARLPFLMNRLRHTGRAWKLMKLSGLALLLTVIERFLSLPVEALGDRTAPTATH